jgi:flagellar hook-length control protein FliK
VNQHGQQQAPQDGQTPKQGTSAHHAAVQDKLDTPAPVAGAAKADPTVVLAEPAATAQVRQPDAVEAAARPVHLRELPEAFRTAVRVAVREGQTSAQLELHPAELGRVEIALRYDGSGGVTATVTAESRAAATALLAQAPELRRALEAQGLTVHGLDVNQAGVGAETSPDRDRLGSFERQPDNDRSREIETDETTTIDVSSLPLAAGQLDVLA